MVGSKGSIPVVIGVGDFDGDGIMDALIHMEEVVNGVGNDFAWYIVKGATPAGTYDPATVGVPLDVPGVAFAQPVGDQNHDGADDLSIGAQLYSGRALADHRPGEPPVQPFASLMSPAVSQYV
ncbi:MAG TPA: hypothetical protein VGI86_02580, partial [Acidimicrobiia bacterium]